MSRSLKNPADSVVFKHENKRIIGAYTQWIMSPKDSVEQCIWANLRVSGSEPVHDISAMLKHLPKCCLNEIIAAALLVCRVMHASKPFFYVFICCYKCAYGSGGRGSDVVPSIHICSKMLSSAEDNIGLSNLSCIKDNLFFNLS